MNNYKGKDIYITRGDSYTLKIKMKDKETGEEIPFKDGDELYLTVKESTTTEDIIIEKILTSFDNNIAVFEFYPSDTKNLFYKPYYYDVELRKSEDKDFVLTIIKASYIYITDEVTW